MTRHTTSGIRALVTFLALAGFSPSPLQAQLPPSRAGEVVAIEGHRFPAAFRVAVRDLRLLRYAHGGLEPIPLQVDERDRDGRFALPRGPEPTADDSPGVFDDNDLLVLLAGDLGDRVALPDAAEIRAYDPHSGRNGWAYLRVDPGAPRATRDDVRYDAGADTIEARRYRLTFGPHVTSAFSFTDASSAVQPNLLDRLKVRVTARILWGLITFRRNESDLSTTVLAWKDGPIRVIRRARMSIRLGYGLPQPDIVAEDSFTADAFEGPVAVQLPFDLRYVFGDLSVRIYLDFRDMEGARVFTALPGSEVIRCDGTPSARNGQMAEWFGLTGRAGTFVHALRFDPALKTVQRRLYLIADRHLPDPPEEIPGVCPAIGYTLSDWGGIGRGTYRIGMIIRAFDHYDRTEIRDFVAGLAQPLTATVAPPVASLRRQ